MLEEALAAVDDADHPLLTMAIDGATPADMAEALQTTPERVAQRVRRMISQLRVAAPTN
jgi:hypothetical protein